jgi:hypothetical protein
MDTRGRAVHGMRQQPVAASDIPQRPKRTTTAHPDAPITNARPDIQVTTDQPAPWVKPLLACARHADGTAEHSAGPEDRERGRDPGVDVEVGAAEAARSRHRNRQHAINHRTDARPRSPIGVTSCPVRPGSAPRMLKNKEPTNPDS